MISKLSARFTLGNTFHGSVRRYKSFGVAFDIDGVFVRGSQPIPGMVDALHKVQAAEIPYVFLTNGGGKTEQAKSDNLQSILNQDSNPPIVLDPKRMIQSHTPLLGVLAEYRDKSVVVVGNYNVCNVAKHYGFHNIVNIADIFPCIPDLHPVTDSLFHAVPYAQRNTKTVSQSLSNFDVDKAEAIFVMNDGLCWAAEFQAIVDMLDNASNGGKQTPIYFTCDDLLYSAKYHRPRMGGGTFRVALEAIYKEITGKQLVSTVIGKPSSVTYEFAENHMRALEGKPIERFYGIGDNPKSDIRGANGRENWTSVLVRTGIFPTNLDFPDNDPEDPADLVCTDVNEAMRVIAEREGISL